jgi:uncharacterized repeat protein (TIGR01451 family)
MGQANPLRFVPVTPCRVADTRNPAGPFGGPSISGGTSRAFNIPASTCGVPSTAQAYSLNVAVVPAGGLSFLTVWPTGQPLPIASTLNSDGRIKSNAAIVAAGTNGSISVFVTNTTDVIVDVSGYFVSATDPTALAFYPIAPCRIADTRTAAGPLGGPSLSAGQSRTFPILSSTCNLPAAARAYSLNFTVVPGSPLFLTAWPTGLAKPVASSLNSGTGAVTANAAIVPAGTNGSVDVFVSGPTDLVIDVNGYFAPMSTGGLSLFTVPPCRLVDTRLPPGSPPVASLNVNTSSACGIPVTAQADVLGVTVIPVPPGGLGFLTMWAFGQPRPTVSTLNAGDGAITSNMAIVPTASASISIFPSSPTHLILDTSGYFGPILPAGLTLTATHVGSFTQGQNGAAYTLTVTNPAGAALTSGIVEVTETLPPGLTLVSIVGTGWTCTSNTCTRSDALSAGASYPPLVATANVAATAGSPLVNSVAVSGGGSAAATANDVTNIAAVPFLTISSSPAGSFTQGATGAGYTLRVSNSGTIPTNGSAVTVTETVPTGMIPTSIGGVNWTCTQPAGPCTRTDVLAAGTSYPPVTMTVNVSQNAPATVTNQAAVFGGGSAGAATSAPTTIAALLRYANPLAFATSASVVGGAATTLTVTYASDNGPSDIASGQIRIDNCYLAWDSSGNLRLYSASPGYADATGVLGQASTLFAGNCGINLANSRLSTPAGNPKALLLTLNVTFPDQAHLSTSDTDIAPDFVGSHEVFAWGTSAEGLATGAVDLGAMVVSQGQDFTLQMAPGGVISMGPGATQVLTLTAMGLNGFNGSIALSNTVQQGPVCFVVTSAPASMAANSQAAIAVHNFCGSSQNGFVGFLYISGSAIGIHRSLTNGVLNGGVELVNAASGDFSVGVGAPTPAVLAPQSSVTYPVTVSSVNGQTGFVNLGVAGMPAGVSYGLSAPQVFLSGPGSVATSFLTLFSSAGTPPGSYSLQLTGTSGVGSHAAVFSLSTQVNTFQVTSATGSAIVHNTGQEVQVTHNVPAGNAPTFTTCSSADPSVACRVISSTAGTVTLGITGASGAVHGTRVLSLNGGRATAHAAFADAPGGGPSLPTIAVQAGGHATWFISIPFFDSCYLTGPCGYEAVNGSAPWITGFVGSGEVTVWVDPPLDTTPGFYSYTAVVCGGFWSPGDGDACATGLGEIEVDAPPPPTVQITRTGTGTVVSGGTQPTVVSVGEKIDLTATVGGLPSGVSVTRSSWGVTGVVVGSYTQSTQTAAKTDFLDPGTNQAVFYWTNSDNVTNYQVTYTATLSDGRTLPVTGAFKVVRPSPAAISATILADAPGKPAINATDQGFFNPSIPSLNLGYNVANGQPGITFDFSLTATFHGLAAMTQLVQFSTTRQTGTASITTTSSGYVLDDKQGIQYGNPVDMQGHDVLVFTLGDTPAVGLPPTLQHAATNQQFKTYLMYQPPSPGSIWVTLRVLTWQWTAGATKGADGKWTVDGGASAPAPLAGTDSAELPLWNNNASNPQQ